MPRDKTAVQIKEGKTKENIIEITEGGMVKGGWNQGTRSQKPNITPSPQSSSQRKNNSISENSSGAKSKGSSD